jgi:hypothetical protein
MNSISTSKTTPIHYREATTLAAPRRTVLPADMRFASTGRCWLNVLKPSSSMIALLARSRFSK